MHDRVLTDPELVAAAYLAAWNERDPDRRRGRLEDAWTPDATYEDPMHRAAGTEEIDRLIAAVQDRFPGFRFRAEGTPQATGRHVRFSWTLGPDGAGEAPIAGTDVAEIRDGRIRAVVGFLDRVPPAA